MASRNKDGKTDNAKASRNKGGKTSNRPQDIKLKIEQHNSH
jgi:hypothetical protein